MMVYVCLKCVCVCVCVCVGSLPPLGLCMGLLQQHSSTQLLLSSTFQKERDRKRKESELEVGEKKRASWRLERRRERDKRGGEKSEGVMEGDRAHARQERRQKGQ